MISSIHRVNRNSCRILSLEIFGPDIAINLSDQVSFIISSVLSLSNVHNLECPGGEIHRSEIGILQPGKGVVKLFAALCLGDAERVLVDVELFGDGDVDGIDVVVRVEGGVALLDLETGLACALLCCCQGQEQGQDDGEPHGIIIEQKKQCSDLWNFIFHLEKQQQPKSLLSLSLPY